LKRSEIWNWNSSLLKDQGGNEEPGKQMEKTAIQVEDNDER
jgi:hypothetical protein